MSGRKEEAFGSFRAVAAEEGSEDRQHTFEVLWEMSNLLDTGLSRESLSLAIGLCECGINPEALAAAVKELQRGAQQRT
ncbi:Mitotic-spindle organizing protein 1 [Balamuthia mandrillaris]